MFELNYCPQCGQKLTKRSLPLEGEVPYCEKCQDFRFPIFSVAVSMIVMNQAKDKVLLIKQYGRDSYILVAGYVNQGEDSEATCRRELKEELNLDLKNLSFNRSSYFAPSNVLMLNYTVVVDEDQLVTPNEEVDAWDWLSVDEARKQIRPNSLAEEFLDEYLDKLSESN
ncbi:NAD(+) diphosphatase [Lactobacillus equicursoris]|uniref:NAD(+) diphosphatase n=1 Tax=Lactobacillus equicursoris TaxID=420645 RepID=UPI0039959E34